MVKQAKRRSPATEQQPEFANYAVGSIIAGKYLIKKIIEGGLGRIFVVSHEGEMFILKTLQHDKADENSFEAEARAWIGIGFHPNVVRALWVDRLSGMLCVAADYIEPDELGRTTFRDVVRMGGVSLQQLLSWSADFCFGMDHAITNGVITHRDIKPENLLLASSGALKITDFGIATKITDFGIATSQSLEWPQPSSGAESIAGTPAYMAPEQWQGRSAGFATDVYAFGLVLFELAFGRSPWKASSQRELYEAHLSSQVTIPEHPLSGFIARCLAKDATDRFANPEKALVALAEVAASARLALPPRPRKFGLEEEELLAKASLSATGNLDHAIAAASTLTERWPSYAPGWTQLGRLWLETGELERAESALRQSVEVDPTRSPPWNNLGVIANQREQFEQAIRCFEQAVACDPQNNGSLSQLGVALGLTGKIREGIARAKAATERAPDKAMVWVNLGSLHRMNQDALEAKKCFDRARACTPPAERNAFDRLLAEICGGEDDQIVDVAELLRNKEFDVAIPLLIGELEKRPKQPELLHNLGTAYLEQGKLADAKAIFDRLIEIEEKNVRLRIRLIEIAIRIKDWTAALQHCDILEQEHETKADGISSRAKVLAASGDNKQARSVLFAALAEHPRHLGLLLTFGDIALASGAPMAAASRGFAPALKLVSRERNRELYDAIEAKLREAIRRAEDDQTG
jgi:tetratricopeptide (TPR) repeat protein